MGLAERFKKTEQQSEKIEIKNTSVRTVTVPEDFYKKFEDLETDTISKIRKTPHWQEFPLKAQERMISKYFDNKIQNKYPNISFSQNEKAGFINNILTLANNR